MIKGSLNNYREDLARFLEEMLIKMKLREIKHPLYVVSTTEDIKDHLIEEILELFNLQKTTKGLVVASILKKAIVDPDEAKDVAILCWGIKLSMKNDAAFNVKTGGNSQL